MHYFLVAPAASLVDTMEQFRRRLLEVDRFRLAGVSFEAIPNRRRKDSRIGEQPGFRFVNSEMLAESRVPDAVLQFGLSPRVLLIGAQVCQAGQRQAL